LQLSDTEEDVKMQVIGKLGKTIKLSLHKSQASDIAAALPP
jgi:hypothetical protein